MNQPVTLVVPTLNKDVGHAAGSLARETASYPTMFNVEVDTKRRGYTATVNAALQRVETPYVCILNDDAKPFTAAWLFKLMKAFTDPNVGFVAPSGPCRTIPQNKALPGAPYGMIEVSHVAFFCVVARMDVLQKLDYLDSRYIHYGSDVDVQWRARELGLKSIWARHVYFMHNVGNWIQPWKDQDQKTFNARWGHK